MTLSDMTFKMWTGAVYERFTYRDMTRVESNANAIATEAGIAAVTFTAVTNASQFDHSEANKLETLIAAIITAVPASGYITPVTNWATSRALAYTDFERWEANLFIAYQTLGGTSVRSAIPRWLRYTLSASAWQGTGPYYQIIDIPNLGDDDGQLFLSVRNTLSEFVQAYGAFLRVGRIGSSLRIIAENIKPKTDIHILITFGDADMAISVTLDANSWTGTGPWTQTVTATGVAVGNEGVAGFAQGTAAQFAAYVSAVIGISAIGSNQITVRAIGKKPTINVPIEIHTWELT